MDNESFGELVKSLRKARTYLDENAYPRQWSQEKLAKEAGLSARQIARIEQGVVADLRPYLEALATAFKLTEQEKKAFYAEAGYVYTMSHQSYDEEELRILLEQLPYPASVRTPLWDFVAVNAYHRIIRGMTPEVVDILNEEPLGPNLLWLLFDARFHEANTNIHHTNWQAESIWAFRATSFRYVRTRRYRFLVNELKQIPGFAQAWQIAEKLPEFGDRSQRRRPTSKIYTAEFGEMAFLSLRIPSRYFGDLEVSVYVPLADSETRYQAFRDSVTDQDVTFFRRHDLD